MFAQTFNPVVFISLILFCLSATLFTNRLKGKLYSCICPEIDYSKRLDYIKKAPANRKILLYMLYLFDFLGLYISWAWFIFGCMVGDGYNLILPTGTIPLIYVGLLFTAISSIYLLCIRIYDIETLAKQQA